MKLQDKFNKMLGEGHDLSKVVTQDKEIWSGFSFGPGPDKLIGGNMEAGFFGEVPTSELISGDALAKLIGLTEGTSQYSSEPWLKFAYMGDVQYVAKKPFRHSISWDAINNARAVFGDRTLNINGRTYKIRLMKGKSEGKQSDMSSDRGAINHNSEWNRLMLPIHTNAPSSWRYDSCVKSPTEDWGVNYSNDELLTTIDYKASHRTWCQEYGTSKTNVIHRGASGVSYSNCSDLKAATGSYGWRPVLELVQG